MVSSPVEYGGAVQSSQRRTVRGIVAATILTALATVVAACSGSSGSSSSGAPSPSTVSTPTCPAVTSTPSPTGPGVTKALQNMPFDLPLPSGITVVGSNTTSDGIHVVRFTTNQSLRSSVLFIVDRYPKAGYVIGRGDAEATEADAPFVHAQVRGLTRVAEVQPCQTLWLVATVTTTKNGVTSPLLVPHPTSSVTSALPFG
jgi:hypothetical protein